MSTEIKAAGVPWRAAWLSTRSSSRGTGAASSRRGQRIAAGTLLELAELGAGLGERGAQQRILVGQPRSASRASARQLLGGVCRIDLSFAACHRGRP